MPYSFKYPPNCELRKFRNIKLGLKIAIWPYIQKTIFAVFIFAVVLLACVMQCENIRYIVV